MSEIREQYREAGTREIMALASKGFKVIMLTPFQYRINNAVDMYPTQARYHVLKTGERGRYPTKITNL